MPQPQPDAIKQPKLPPDKFLSSPNHGASLDHSVSVVSDDRVCCGKPLSVCTGYSSHSQLLGWERIHQAPFFHLALKDLVKLVRLVLWGSAVMAAGSTHFTWALCFLLHSSVIGVHILVCWKNLSSVDKRYGFIQLREKGKNTIRFPSLLHFEHKQMPILANQSYT